MYKMKVEDVEDAKGKGTGMFGGKRKFYGNERRFAISNSDELRSK